ncbi:MAG: hypothetical protein IKZ49_02430 [Alphaproteobacteria bacterium]|nr:hypothetical protein [Alphaproteobacteria bacterium]
MKIVCPVLENKLFKSYKDINYKTFVNTSKLTGAKKVNKIRDNTTKIVKEPQPVIILGELLERDIENNKQKEIEPIAIEKLNIKPALLRWGLLKIGKVKNKHDNHKARKQKRFKARMNAYNCKSVLQNYQYELPDNKESNLQKLVSEYEMESKKNTDLPVAEKEFAELFGTFDSDVAFNTNIVFSTRYSYLMQEKAEEKELKKSADEYFKQLRIKENRFVKKIETAKAIENAWAAEDEQLDEYSEPNDNGNIDLQDVYELCNHNMNIVVNFVNQKAK